MRDEGPGDPAECALSLFGDWPPGPAGHGAGSGLLELKSAEPAAPMTDLVDLLNELTGEMAEQFRLFRILRGGAETLIRAEAGGEAGDTTASDAKSVDGKTGDSKTARADVKAATDAMSLIVRTLEKIDALQRQLARDRAEAEARRTEEDGDEAILERLERIIAQRVEERAAEMARGYVQGRSEEEQGMGAGLASSPAISST